MIAIYFTCVLSVDEEDTDGSDLSILLTGLPVTSPSLGETADKG